VSRFAPAANFDAVVAGAAEAGLVLSLIHI